MKTDELKERIEEQKKRNIDLFNSIPLASREDPTNEKAEPILAEWRKGSKMIKCMIKQLQEMEMLENKKTHNKQSEKTFVNGYGEATKRNITCNGYERAEKRNSQAIMSFMGR